MQTQKEKALKLYRKYVGCSGNEKEVARNMLNSYLDSLDFLFSYSDIEDDYLMRHLIPYYDKEKEVLEIIKSCTSEPIFQNYPGMYDLDIRKSTYNAISNKILARLKFNFSYTPYANL